MHFAAQKCVVHGRRIFGWLWLACGSFYTRRSRDRGFSLDWSLLMSLFQIILIDEDPISFETWKCNFYMKNVIKFNCDFQVYRSDLEINAFNFECIKIKTATCFVQVSVFFQKLSNFAPLNKLSNSTTRWQSMWRPDRAEAWNFFRNRNTCHVTRNDERPPITHNRRSTISWRISFSRLLPERKTRIIRWWCVCRQLVLQHKIERIKKQFALVGWLVVDD